MPAAMCPSTPGRALPAKQAPDAGSTPANKRPASAPADLQGRAATARRRLTVEDAGCPPKEDDAPAPPITPVAGGGGGADSRTDSGVDGADDGGGRSMSPSISFDEEYLELLRTIRDHGFEQQNKKGPNTTLPHSALFKIELRGDDDAEDFLPITTLRKTDPTKAVVEAIWMLRGDDDITFMQKHRCRFWDTQALNNKLGKGGYTLLTNWPNPPNGNVNQLEEQVVKPLCELKDGVYKCSRNMVCSLVHPILPTVQPPCTSAVQFTVTSIDGDQERLNITLHQRSSDVMLGLPHDVVAWTVILHLVRREVARRTGGKRCLAAGSLTLNLASAHNYGVNAEQLQKVLARKPVPGLAATLGGQETSLRDVKNDYTRRTLKMKFPILGFNADLVHKGIKVNHAT
mmetsp:Transcript_67779/g.187235  ORF Transcript_67779/g.187235 Transcript_67779/m.187235 type:complete len:401 (-) Transcript_67779:106-1308(-)